MDKTYAVSTCFDDMATAWVVKLTDHDFNNPDNFGIKDPFYLIPVKLTEEYTSIKEFFNGVYDGPLNINKNLSAEEVKGILNKIFRSETFFGRKMDRFDFKEIK